MNHVFHTSCRATNSKISFAGSDTTPRMLRQATTSRYNICNPAFTPPLTWFLSLACNCNPQKCGEHLCSETPIEWSIAQRHDDTASSVISIIQATYRCERNAPCHRFAVRLTMQWGSWSTSAPRVSFQCIRSTTSTLPHRRSSSVLYSRVHGINSLSPSTPL